MAAGCDRIFADKVSGTRAPLLVEPKANPRWSLDFVYDQFANGRRLSILNIFDDVTKESPQKLSLWT